MVGIASATETGRRLAAALHLKRRLMITELVDSLLIAGLLPAIILWIKNHRPYKIVRIDHPSALRTDRHIRSYNCLEIGFLVAKGRADRSCIGLMDRDVDLRPNVLLVENWITDAVRANAKAHDRAEFDVCLRQGIHDVAFAEFAEMFLWTLASL